MPNCKHNIFNVFAFTRQIFDPRLTIYLDIWINAKWNFTIQKMNLKNNLRYMNNISIDFFFLNSPADFVLL